MSDANFVLKQGTNTRKKSLTMSFTSSLTTELSSIPNSCLHQTTCVGEWKPQFPGFFNCVCVVCVQLAPYFLVISEHHSKTSNNGCAWCWCGIHTKEVDEGTSRRDPCASPCWRISWTWRSHFWWVRVDKSIDRQGVSGSWAGRWGSVFFRLWESLSSSLVSILFRARMCALLVLSEFSLPPGVPFAFSGCLCVLHVHTLSAAVQSHRRGHHQWPAVATSSRIEVACFRTGAAVEHRIVTGSRQTGQAVCEWNGERARVRCVCVFCFIVFHSVLNMFLYLCAAWGGGVDCVFVLEKWHNRPCQVGEAMHAW